MLVQSIKFKNNFYGNPREIILKYKTPQVFEQKKIEHIYPVEAIEVGYEGSSNHYNDGDIILPTIYSYLPYSKVVKQYTDIISF